MTKIKFSKNGSNDIRLGKTWYRPVTLEQILNITTAFYAQVEDEDEDGNSFLRKGPTRTWFNMKGLTYIKK